MRVARHLELGVQGVLDNFVTRASGGFQAVSIQDGDIAPAVADQILLLQRVRSLGHADAPHTQDVG